MKVVFRADASLQIGTGHIMRCLTLAEVLRARGGECAFVCRDHPRNMIDVLRQRGFFVHSLPYDSDSQTYVTKPVHADWLGGRWETDAEQTKFCFGKTAIDWLIVDHYALDSRWESALRPYCKRIMVIDDLADRDHDCDLLLDQNLVADMVHRYNRRVPEHCGLLIGPHYGLLQPQYAELHPRTLPRTGPVRRIFVYFSGADIENLTGRAISAFLALDRPGIALDVVINPADPRAAAIQDQVLDHPNITLHENLPSLAHLMLKADLAIGAGGATSWERCCLGLPSLVVTLAENQKPIAAELDRQGIVRWLGDHAAVSELMLKVALLDALEDQRITDWSRLCLGLVDGMGAERVAAIVSLDSNTQTKARRARLEDEALILRWANDPLVRQNAFNPNEIDPYTHRAWFYRRLSDPENCQIYVVEESEGLPIGQVRFERINDNWEIHYALDAVARGRKLGKKMLQSALLEFRRLSSGVLLFGRVKRSNLASQRVFEELDFLCEAGEEEQIVYRRSF